MPPWWWHGMAWRAPGATWTSWPATWRHATASSARHPGAGPGPSGRPGRPRSTALRSMRAWRQTFSTNLALKQAQWVGTSMGGAIGTVCAAGVYRTAPAGPRHPPVAQRQCAELAPAALQRIRAYAGQPPAFDTVLELEMFFRQVLPALWLAERCAVAPPLPKPPPGACRDGRVTPHYDPAMVQQFTHHDQRLPDLGPLRRARRPRCCACAAPSDLVLRDTARPRC